MICREEILRLIPHQGRMCLLDQIVDWSAERILARSESHHSIDHPLRLHGRLRSVHLAEYGAQAMAVHGGLLARQSEQQAQPGLLVSLRGLQLRRRYVDDLPGPLDVQAELLLSTPASWQYRFQIQHEGDVIADGRAAIMLHAV